MQGRWKGHTRYKGSSDNPTTVRYTELSCSDSRCVSIDPAEGPEGVKVLTAIAGEGEIVSSGAGKLCEMVTGGTSVDVNGLTVSDGQATWDQLGRVQCSYYRRKGQVLEITTARPSEAPEGVLVLPQQQLEGDVVTVLEPIDPKFGAPEEERERVDDASKTTGGESLIEPVVGSNVGDGSDEQVRTKEQFLEETSTLSFARDHSSDRPIRTLSVFAGLEH